MERVEFLIEATHARIPCMLNPENLTIKRVSGARRVGGQLVSYRLSDDPVHYSGRGHTSFELQLLFDVALLDRPNAGGDVRALTRPLWQLTEYVTAAGQFDQLPTARFIWGKAWNVRVVIESISQRFARVSRTGTPESALLNMSLLRVSEEAGRRVQEKRPFHPTLRHTDQEALATPTPDWGVHTLLADERLEQVAQRFYGDPAMWRLIARANFIDDPQRIPAGTALRIPPLARLR